jgi:hypothetical protein
MLLAGLDYLTSILLSLSNFEALIHLATDFEKV